VRMRALHLSNVDGKFANEAMFWLVGLLPYMSQEANDPEAVAKERDQENARQPDGTSDENNWLV